MNTTANSLTRSFPQSLRRLLAATAALAMLAGACGDSDEPSNAGGGDVDDPGLDDPELDQIIEDVISDVNADMEDTDSDDTDSDDADPRFDGYRLWTATGVEEIQAGAVGNLAPNPLDEFAFEGLRFDVVDPAFSSGDIHLPTVVASYDHAWVIAGGGSQLARLDYATNTIDREVTDLATDGEVVALLGDENALYAVIQLLDEAAVVELDPATGGERDRTTIDTSGGLIVGADSNDDWITMSFSASAIPVPLVSRSTLAVEAEIENLDHKAALLTDTELAMVERASTASGGDSLQFYSLADQSPGELIEMPGNGTTRAFGDTIVQSDQNEGVVHGIAGDGPAIANALAALESDNITIGDIHIGDGFAIVQGCCADIGGERQSLFVIDLGSGAILLSSSANGTIVPPPA